MHPWCFFYGGGVEKGAFVEDGHEMPICIVFFKDLKRSLQVFWTQI